MSEEIDDGTYSQILRLCAEGDRLADAEEYHSAIAQYRRAFALLPPPPERWEAATWVLAALGDMYYLTGDDERAREALARAMHCPDAVGNPFIHLRLGQAQYEIGNMERARDELARAYMGGGKEMFEAEDAKFFEFVKSALLPPAGGEW